MQSKKISKYLILSLSLLSTSLVAEKVFATNPDSATLEAIVGPSVNITLSASDIALDVNPVNKPFDSTDITAEITTNSTDGYNLYLYSDNTSLVNQNYSGKTIDTLPTSDSGYDETNFLSDKWGYKIGDANYHGLVSGVVIGSSDGPVDKDEANLTFGAKVSNNTAAGSYNGTLVFRAIAIVST